jgi:nucleosome binding factor SPN SPT16 subunit
MYDGLKFYFQENYNFLLQIEEEILKKLTAGTKLSEVYEVAIKFVKDEQPKMVEHLTKSFGFAMGIEFRESSMVLGPKTNVYAKKGMVFNVNVGLSNLTNSEATDKETKTYALFVGDTVLVNEVGRIYIINFLIGFVNLLKVNVHFLNRSIVIGPTSIDTYSV